ncbi:MAG: hypothetical protein ABH956_01380 [Candidatus Nealsonbacteria bacterium]
MKLPDFKSLKVDKTIQKPKSPVMLFWVIIVMILLFGNIFFGAGYFYTRDNLEKVKSKDESCKINEKVLNFTAVFIGKVLKAEGEVDFEDRLEIENLVRDLDDEEILNQWQKFVQSKSENQAEKEVKNLLEMLIYKIKR